jgi:hypothetical protein
MNRFTILVVSAVMFLGLCYQTVVADGSIAGYKFDDLNSNSIWDGGEPGLINWEINLFDGPNLMGQTMTDVNGYYQFDGLVPGTYGVSETNQPAWVQTYPLSVFYMIDLEEGDNLTGFDFGNSDTTCVDSIMWETCFDGTMDDFVGPEPCHWSTAMESWITGQNHIENFDEPAADQFFGHTIEGCWEDYCLVLEATLTIRMTPSDGGCGNDGIHLGEYGGSGTFWWTYISELCGDNTWEMGDVETFTLDLADLPVTGHDRTNNILAGLQDGSLDVVVQDDSKVDWIQLDVRLCCPTCFADGDADGNGIGLTVADLSYLTQFIADCGAPPDSLHKVDLNGDCVVDSNDIRIYVDYFTYGLSVFDPYGGYPVPTCCDPTLEPIPDTVTIFGLEHVSGGTACYDTTGGVLNVTRIAEEPCDTLVDANGDTIIVIRHPSKSSRLVPFGSSVSNLEDAGIAWSGDYEHDSTMQTAASIQVEAYGFVDGDSDQVIASTVETKQADKCWALAVKAPVTSYTITAYLDRDIVWSQSDMPASDEWFQIGRIGHTAKAESSGGPFGSSVSNLEDAGIISIGWDPGDAEPGDPHVWNWGIQGIVDLAFDRLRVDGDCDDGVEVGDLTHIVHYTMNVPSYTIISESQTIDYGGIAVTNLGHAVLATSDDTLFVSNIGSSGEAGIMCEPEDGDYPDDLIYRSLAEIIIENPDQDGTFPVGGSLEAEFTFPLNGQPEPFTMSVSQTKTAANTWDLAADGDAELYTVEAFLNSLSVFSAADVGTTDLGYIVESAKGVYPVGYNGASTNKPAPPDTTKKESSWIWRAPDGVEWTWPAQGVSNLRIDSLSVSTEIYDDSTGGISHVSLTGANGAKSDPISFTILDIEFGLSYICGDCNTDGVANITDAVYLITYIFGGGPSPDPLAAGDANCDGTANITDAVYLITYIFGGGPPPCDPDDDGVPDC